MKQLLAGLKILVVDDEQDLREILQSEFEFEGATVYSAENGVKAFEIFQNEKIDIVVSDIRMPGGNGIDLLDKIKAINASLPLVLFMTGFSDLKLEDAYEKGADAIFSKPFKIQDIIEKCQRAILPPEERFNRVVENSESIQSLSQVHEAFSEALESGKIQLGRGGFFIQDEKNGNRIKEGLCHIQLQFKSGPISTLDLIGVVVWKREEPKDPYFSGFGVEFFSLEKQDCERIFKEIHSAKVLAYIPSGRTSI